MSESVLEVDASGLKCPLPVLKARKAIRPLAPGALVRVISTVPASPLDFAHFCQSTGHELVETSEADGRFVFVLRKAAA